MAPDVSCQDSYLCTPSLLSSYRKFASSSLHISSCEQSQILINLCRDFFGPWMVQKVHACSKRYIIKPLGPFSLRMSIFFDILFSAYGFGRTKHLAPAYYALDDMLKMTVSTVASF